MILDKQALLINFYTKLSNRQEDYNTLGDLFKDIKSYAKTQEVLNYQTTAQIKKLREDRNKWRLFMGALAATTLEALYYFLKKKSK